MLSKRLRMVIRLIALEERLQQQNAGALPPQVMMTLRLLSDYKEARRKKNYKHRGLAREMPVSFENLVAMCKHDILPGGRPVIAKLWPAEALQAGVTEGVYCCVPCAAGRRVVCYLSEHDHLGH